MRKDPTILTIVLFTLFALAIVVIIHYMPKQKIDQTPKFEIQKDKPVEITNHVYDTPHGGSAE